MDVNYQELVERQRDELFAHVALSHTPADVEKIKEAYYFAEKAHANQKRKDGEPYITHPIAVAKIINDDLVLGTNPDNAANTLQSAGFTEIYYLYEGIDFLEYKAPDDVEVIMVRASKYADNGGGVTVSLTYYYDILGHYFVGGLYPTATAIKGVFLPWSEALDQYMGGDNWKGEVASYADGDGVMSRRSNYVKYLQDHADMSKTEYIWVDEEWKSGNIESELYLNTYDSDIPKGFVRIWFSIDLNLY